MRQTAILIACAALLTGCGLRNPDAPAPTAPSQSTQAPAPPAPPTQPSLPLYASAQSVLAAFATTYATTSAADVVRQQRTLSALATPALAAQLRRSAAQAVIEARHALPPGAQLSGSVLSLQVASGTNVRRGVVVIQQALTRAGQALESPFTSVFLARVERTRARWFVGEWTPQR